MNSKVNATLALDVLVSDDNVNVREYDNYDLESMVQALIQVGYVTDPIHVEDLQNGKYLVLKGNRRVRGCRLIKDDHNISEKIKAAFLNIPAVVYTGLTPAERTDLIFDHGTTKLLSRVETCKGVWRLAAEMKTFDEIAALMYHQLAQMGDVKKLANVPADPIKRKEYLKDWFNGTLNQWLLLGCAMGDYVQDQFIKSLKKQDGKLAKTNNGWDFDVDRKRTAVLWKAKKEDTAKGGWTPPVRTVVEGEIVFEGGGESFNKLLKQYIGEDSGVLPSNEKKRMTKTQLEQRIGAAKSPVVQDALAATLGDTEAGIRLAKHDQELERQQMKRDALAVGFQVVRDSRVKGLINAILSGGPAADVEAALMPFATEQILWVPDGVQMITVDESALRVQQVEEKLTATEKMAQELHDKLMAAEARAAEAEAALTAAESHGKRRKQTA